MTGGGERGRRADRLMGACACAIGLATPALAQAGGQPPAASQVTPRDIAPPAPSVVTPQAAPPTKPQPRIAVPPGADEVRMDAGRIVIEGGFPELADATRILIAPLEGRTTTVGEFYRRAAMLEQAYSAAGFPFARVVVPPQRFTAGGIARLTVVDGYIESIDVSAAPRRLRAPLRHRLHPLIGKRHLKGAELIRRATLAGDLPGVRMKSALGRGTKLGGVRLIVEAAGDPASVSLSGDNRQAAAFDKWEATGQAALNSLLGQGEQIYGFVSLDPKEGVHALDRGRPRRVAGAGVNLPIGGNGLALNVEGLLSLTQPITTGLTTRSPFARLSARLSYPLIRTRISQLLLTVSAEATTERQSAPDFGLDLYRDKLRVLRLAADYTTALPHGIDLVANVTVSQGLAGLGARGLKDEIRTNVPLSRYGAVPDFSKVEARLSLQKRLPAGLIAGIVARTQLEPFGTVMPSSELFALDGTDALTPFTSGALSSDSGGTLRGQVSRPIPLWGRLQVAPYAYGAVARATNGYRTVYDTRHAAAYGIGAAITVARLGPLPVLTATVDYGRGTSDGPIPDGNRLTLLFGARF